MTRKDFSKQKFHMLTAIEFVEVRKGTCYWRFVCDCGKSTIKQASKVKDGRVKSCGCVRYQKGKIFPSMRLPPGEAGKRNIFRDYQNRAKRKGIEFSLTIEEFAEITKQRCVYCGVEPRNECRMEWGAGTYFYNGIDRIDNAIGYTQDNVAPCCAICNYAKKTSSVEDFRKWIVGVYTHWASK
jgi:hypothetical protein